METRVVDTSRRLRAALLLLVAIAGVAAFADRAAANTFGGYTINSSCCTIWGSRASITTPSSSSQFNPPGANCDLARSDAESGTSWLIQVGFLRCGPSSPGLDNTCSLFNNLIYFTEIKPPGSNYQCFNSGSTETWGKTDLFTVDNTSGSTWWPYINGNQLPHSISAGSAGLISGDSEWTGFCSDSFTNTATYGTPTAWQRWTGGSWFTIQQANPETTCGWHVSGSPPGSFTISH